MSADTKRKILKTIAAVFDPYNFEGPILNRARVFLHELQSDKNIDWDSKLDREKLRNWNNITKQYNSSDKVNIKRFVGCRSEDYRIIAFADASTVIYGCV